MGWWMRVACTLPFGMAVMAGAQGVAPEQWSEAERQFVQNARGLYQQQGLVYTDEQAASAVQQMRQRASTATPSQGVPESEWSPQEREFVNTAREQYRTRGMPFTQEQAQLAVQAMRNRIAQFTGSAGALQALAQTRSPLAAPAPSAAAGVAQRTADGPTEDQIARTLESWPPKPQELVLTGRKDGFDINGQPVLDPEGRIFSYAADVVGGSITYAVQSSRGVIVKTMSAADPSRKLVLATGRQTQNGWDLVTSSGQAMGGHTLAVLSDGFLLGRESAAFRYKAGQGVTSIAVPTGYFLGPLQRGQVGATGYVLLEKEAATGTDSFSRLAASLQTIGSIVGTNRKEDFALMDIRTRKLHPLNISANGKDVHVHSQCRKKNWLVSECAQMQSFEALYDPQGFKNGRHYYWSIHWLNTPAGPVAITLEDGQANLYVTDLQSGRKVVALNRSLGIADWDAMQRGDGSVGLRGKLAFEWQEVPDVTRVLQQAAP